MDAQTRKASTAEVQRLASDASEIGLRVGVSADYVRKVLAGERNNIKVVRAHRKLLKQRAQAIQEFQKGTQQCG